jgi:hypothetical protein
MFRTLIKYTLAGGTLATGALAYEGYRLSKEYPWRAGLTPGAQGAIPLGTSEGGHITAVVAHPPLSARTAPLDTFISAFYSTWTLRIEGWVAKKGGFKSTPPPHVPITGDEFANGLFRGVFRAHPDPSSAGSSAGTLMVAWNAPGAKEGAPSPGGIQVFTAHVGDEGELEISFGGAEWEPPYGPKLDGKVGTLLHHFYSRYLLDSARHKLEAMGREGK